MSVAVIVEHVQKEFENGGEITKILHDINLTLNQGELTYLVGPSGCGKTTLISIISGILSASQGQVSIINRNITTMKDQERVLFRRKHIGFIFQQFNLLPALTAEENAAMPLVVAGMSLEEATPKARVILQDIGMGNATHKLPRQLSGGQQQRVAIARALVHSPSLIVCDEPTASLDGKTGYDVMSILQTIARDPERCVLVVTHDSRIFSFADRIIDMSDGHIIGNYSAHDYILKEQTTWQKN